MNISDDDKYLLGCCSYRIVEEGMLYCFDGYSSWSEIKDEEFHRLRKNFLESAKALKKYVDENGTKEE